MQLNNNEIKSNYKQETSCKFWTAQTRRSTYKSKKAPFFDPCVRFQKKYGAKSEMNRIVAYMYLKD